MSNLLNGDKPITSFKGKYGFLSNFYPSIIIFDDDICKTAEHLYQAMKMITYSYFLDVLNEPTPGKAKRLGNKLPMSSNWDKIKINVMSQIIIEKFKQNKGLQKYLINTGNATLIEGNYWHDNYWGNCYCPKCKNIQGENHLGKILMKVRELYGSN